MTRRRPPAVWFFVLAYTGLGLWVALAWFPLGDLAVESDFFAELGPAAQAIARGDLSVHHHPYKGPMHGLLLAGLHTLLAPLGVGWHRAAVLLSLLATAGALLLVHRLVAAHAGGRAAMIATVLTGAVYEVFVQAHKASSDPLFLLLLLATVAVTGPPRRWLPAGALAGAAFLTRYLGAAVMVWVLLMALLNRPRARPAGLALLGMLLVVGPWLAFSWLESGSLLVTRNLENIARGMAPAIGEEAAWSATSLVDLIGRDPPRVLGHYARQVVTMPWRDASHLIGFPLAMVAAAGLLRRRPLSWPWLLFGVLHVLAVGWVFYLPRFNLPLVPIYAALAAVALAGRRLAWLAVALLVGYHAVQATNAVRYYRAEQPLALSPVIAHLESLRGDERRPVLMARTAHAAFHAGWEHRFYPRQPLSAAAFLDHARAQGAGWLLVGPVERRLAANLAFLDDLADYAGLEPAYVDTAAVLYRLDHDAADFGQDRRASRLAAIVAQAHLDEALDPAHELMHRHLRAGHHREAIALLDDLLARCDPALPEDRDLARRLRQDRDWIASQEADRP